MLRYAISRYINIQKISSKQSEIFLKSINTLKTLRYFDHNDLADNYYHGHACHRSYFLFASYLLS